MSDINFKTCSSSRFKSMELKVKTDQKIWYTSNLSLYISIYLILDSALQVSNLASEAKKERIGLSKEVSKISDYGISV